MENRDEIQPIRRCSVHNTCAGHTSPTHVRTKRKEDAGPGIDRYALGDDRVSPQLWTPLRSNCSATGEYDRRNTGHGYQERLQAGLFARAFHSATV